MTQDPGLDYEEDLIGRKDSKAPRGRILILVGYSYFFESFFLRLAAELSDGLEFDVWFDDNPTMFSLRDFEQAVSLAGSFGIGRVERHPLSIFWDDTKHVRPIEWLASVRTNLARLSNVARSRDYSAVITMNSAILTILPVVIALRNLNLRVIVVRSTILEAPLLLLLRDFFPDVAFSPQQLAELRAKVSLAVIFSYLRKVLIQLRGAANWTRNRQRRAPTKGLSAYLMGFMFGLVRASPVFVAFAMRGLGVTRPMLSAQESEYSVANSRLTDLVLIPGRAHLNHLEQLFPGPKYCGYSSFFEREDRQVPSEDLGLNLILPLSTETSAAALALFSGVAGALARARDWDVIRYRNHPREFPNQPNPFLSEAEKLFQVPSEDVSGLSFTDFSNLSGRFFVIGASSAITSLSFVSPSARIGILSIDGGAHPGEDGRYLEGFGNSRLLRTAEDATLWASKSFSMATVSRDRSLVGILRRELMG